MNFYDIWLDVIDSNGRVLRGAILAEAESLAAGSFAHITYDDIEFDTVIDVVYKTEDGEEVIQGIDQNFTLDKLLNTYWVASSGEIYWIESHDGTSIRLVKATSGPRCCQAIIELSNLVAWANFFIGQELIRLQ